MTRFKRLAAGLLGASALALAACDGGTSTQTSFIPAPPPSPPPPQDAKAVTILPQPVAGSFAVTGAWTNLYTASATQDGRFESIDASAANQPQIRYAAGGYYEVKLPDEDYGPLVHDTSFPNPPPDDPFLTVTDCCGTRPVTVQSSGQGFTYSAMASWSRPDLDFGYTIDAGVFAFGKATPAGDVPVTGSASYGGVVAGLTDAKTFIPVDNTWSVLPANGTVQLDFDFARGTLGGRLDLSVADGMNPVSVGSYDFAQTVFSPGSTAYSGSFATNLTGANFFGGLFTGPHAEETIANWAVPFEYNGEIHQAFGAWVAKAH